MDNKEVITIEKNILNHYKKKFGRQRIVLNGLISIFLILSIFISSYYLVSIQNTDEIKASGEISKVISEFNKNNLKSIYKEEVITIERQLSGNNEQREVTKSFIYSDDLTTNEFNYIYSVKDGDYSYTNTRSFDGVKNQQIITYINGESIKTFNSEISEEMINKRNEMFETIKLIKYLVENNKVKNLIYDNENIFFDVEYNSIYWTKEAPKEIKLITTFVINKNTYLPIKTTTKSLPIGLIDTESTYLITFDGENSTNTLVNNNNEYLKGEVNIVWNKTTIPNVFINNTKLEGKLVYNENSDLKDTWKILNGKEIIVQGETIDNSFIVKSINY